MEKAADWLHEPYNDQPFEYQTPMEMVKAGKFVTIAAPMVRYSKLPFRMLCRRWGCDVAFSAMIIAEDFVLSSEARKSEFSTNKYDRPLIVQFAAKTPQTLAKAAEFVVGHCDGIDINCGCPQRWVMKEGYGSAMLDKPELVKDMVHCAKEATKLPCSIKIRYNSKDIRKTIELVQRAERVGVEWITVHGRTPQERSSSPVNFDVVKLIKESVSVPVFANGNCFELSDANNWKEKTGVDGIMAARGILLNPALFKGYKVAPKECIDDWIDIAMGYAVTTHFLHQHLMFMLFRQHTRVEKKEFNTIKTIPGIIDYLDKKYSTNNINNLNNIVNIYNAGIQQIHM